MLSMKAQANHGRRSESFWVDSRYGAAVEVVAATAEPWPSSYGII